MRLKTAILLLALWFTPAFAFHDQKIDHEFLVELARDAVLVVISVDAEGKGLLVEFTTFILLIQGNVLSASAAFTSHR